MGTLALEDAKKVEINAAKSKIEKEIESLSKKLGKKKKEIKSLERKNSQRKKKIRRLEEEHKKTIQSFREELKKQKHSKKQQQIPLKFLNILMGNKTESTEHLKINFGKSSSKKEKEKSIDKVTSRKDSLEEENVGEEQVSVASKDNIHTESFKESNACFEKKSMNENESTITS